MAVSVLECKTYLAIPVEDSTDDALLGTLIQAGEDYLYNAIDNFDALYDQNERFTRQADLFIRTQYVPHMYDQREGMNAGGDHMGKVAQAMIEQMQLFTSEGSEEDA